MVCEHFRVASDCQQQMLLSSEIVQVIERGSDYTRTQQHKSCHFFYSYTVPALELTILLDLDETSVTAIAHQGREILDTYSQVKVPIME